MKSSVLAGAPAREIALPQGGALVLGVVAVAAHRGEQRQVGLAVAVEVADLRRFPYVAIFVPPVRPWVSPQETAPVSASPRL